MNALAKAGAVGRLPLLRLFLVERDGSHKLEVLSSTEADVAGIWRWLDAQASLESEPD